MKLFRWFKSLGIISAILIILFASASPVSAYGKNQYFLSFLYNTESKSFSSLVVQDSGQYRTEATYSKLDSTDSMIYLTYKAGTSLLIVEGKMVTPQTIVYGSVPTTVDGVLTLHPYTFPEFGDADGVSIDLGQANSVGSKLSSALNTAINLIIKPVSTAGRKELDLQTPTSFLKLAAAVSNCGYDVMKNKSTSFVSCSYGKLPWSMRMATESDISTIKDMPKGASYLDYVVIKNYSNKIIVVPYLIPKGYQEGQALFGQIDSSIDVTTLTAKLSWGHVVYMAGAQLAKGSTVQNPGTLSKDDAFTKLISGFFRMLIDGLTSVLGLFSVNELMFNSGNRGATYFFGIMPNNWLNAVSVLNLFGTVISFIVIGISIIRILIRRNLAAITPSMKAEMMDGVKDLFIVIIGIALFMPALYILLGFNDTIVTALRNMAPSGEVLGLTTGSGFIGVLLQIAFVFVQILLNVTYLIRAITLALLIGFAPLFISLFAAGGASKKIAGTWLKELLANIMLQSFNAAMLLVFANIGAYGSLSILERFVLLISFIPLTKFFKNVLMNLGSGTDTVSERTGGAFTNLASSMAAGALLSRVDGKSEKNGKMVGNDGKPLSSSVVASDATTASNIKPDKSSAFESLKGGLSNFGKNALKPKEIARLAGKGAVMAAGAGVSLGSAATGGSSLIANSAVIASANSIANQMEGWAIPDAVPVEPSITMEGSELINDGYSGFSGDATVFSSTARDNINGSPESKSKFMSEVETYNADPKNANSQAKILSKDDGSIYGAKIDGVKGKTLTRKDPITNKAIASESVISGSETLKRFTPTLAGFSKVREKVKKEPEDNHNNGSDYGSQDQDTSGT